MAAARTAGLATTTTATASFIIPSLSSRICRFSSQPILPFTAAAAAPNAASSAAAIVPPLRSSPLSSTSKNRRFRRFSAVSDSSTSAGEALEICVKAAATSPTRLGDCPFCQRVLLTLEEKHLPYDMKLIDFAHKPDWFLELNPEGKVPVIKLENKWVSDSDVITRLLEEKYPDPPLTTTPEKATVGSKIFKTFVGFLTSKEPNDETEQALLSELASFNDYIRDNGPFINGKEVSGADLALGPKLYHLEIALGHYKNWSIPESLSHLMSYMKSIFARDSFIKTRAQPEDVIAGWRPKVLGS